MGNIGNKLFQFSKSGPGDALSKFYSPFSCGGHFVHLYNFERWQYGEHLCKSIFEFELVVKNKMSF